MNRIQVLCSCILVVLLFILYVVYNFTNGIEQEKIRIDEARRERERLEFCQEVEDLHQKNIEDEAGLKQLKLLEEKSRAELAESREKAYKLAQDRIKRFNEIMATPPSSTLNNTTPLSINNGVVVEVEDPKPVRVDFSNIKNDADFGQVKYKLLY